MIFRESDTCLQDLGLLLRSSGFLAYSTLVLREHSERVGVAHDEVGDGGIQSMVMLQHGEPVLQTHSEDMMDHRRRMSPSPPL